MSEQTTTAAVGPSAVSQTTVAQSSSGGNSGKIILCSCLALLALLACCCITIVLFFSLTFGAALGKIGEVGNVFDKVCNANQQELSSVYKVIFTEDYKSRVSASEFETFFQQNKSLFAACGGKVGKLDYSAIVNGAKVNYNNSNGKETFEIQLTIEGKLVDIDLVAVGNDWKIDDLRVDGKGADGSVQNKVLGNGTTDDFDGFFNQ